MKKTNDFYQKILEKEFQNSKKIIEVRVKPDKQAFENLCYQYLENQISLTNKKFKKIQFVENFVNNFYDWLITKNGKFNPHKGFLLTGINRLGKTTIANLISFIIKNFIKIEIENKLTNLNILKIHALELKPKSYKKFNILFIDDIGKEPITHIIQGQEISVFADMISLRYFEKIKNKQIFYDIITTNLTLMQIEQKYGIHTATRIYETMNIVQFDKRILKDLGLNAKF